jgi:hypothetical protein
MSVEEWKDVYSLLGIDDNCNALSNYFREVLEDFQQENTQSLKKKFKNVIHVWNEDQSGLEERLHWLEKQAQKLSKSSLAKSWADYRSNFGGKLKSWLSNYHRQKQLIEDGLKNQKEEFQKIDTQKDSPDFQQEGSVKIAQLSKQLLKIINETLNKEINLTYQRFFLYRDLLAELRTQLNYYHQAQDKSEELVREVYPHIFKDLELVPQFFGKAKTQRYQKYIKTAELIEQGFNFLNNNFTSFSTNQKQIETDVLRKKLESLHRYYFTANTNRYKPLIETILTKYTETIPPENHKYFKHPRSTDPRTKQIELNLENTNTINDLERIQKNLNLESDWKHLSAAQLIDYIELLKIKWSIAVLLSDQKILVKPDELSLFDKASAYLSIFGNSIPSEKISQFIQSFVLSELKGAVNLLSRKEFITRSTSQFIESHEKFPIVYLPLDKKFGKDHIPEELRTEFPKTAEELLGDKSKIPDFKILSYYPHKWAVIDRDHIKNTPVENYIPALVIQGKKRDEFKVKYVDKNELLQIRTSTYQLQFLEKFLRPPAKWRDIQLRISEPSLILEEKFKVSWDRQNLQVKLDPAGSRQLFYSLPFNLEPQIDTAARSKAIDNRNAYLGIDVGEYGLAWSCLKFNQESKCEQLGNGFIFSHELREIREHVANMKNRQLKGTFGMPSTSLARIRESVIHSLRNKLHDLALRYNAKLIYEMQISNFETGSARVSKVYRSVKTADVHPENDADRAVMEQTWGKGTKYMGTHLSAYATSQTCSKCHKTIADDLDWESSFEVKRQVEGSIFELQNNQEIFKVYSDRKLEIGQQLDEKTAKNLALKFMRPPAESDVLNWKNVSVPEEFTATRGNSAIFVCPFCDHVADADIQAATNIAFRGYLRDKYKEEKSDERFDYIGKIKKHAEKNEYPLNELRV